MTLKADIQADIAGTFLNTDEFADSITFAPAGMEVRTIAGIFDAPYEAINPDTGYVESSAPSALVASSDVIGIISHGDLMTIDGTTYEVIGIKPDGTGMTRVVLSQD